LFIGCHPLLPLKQRLKLEFWHWTDRSANDQLRMESAQLSTRLITALCFQVLRRAIVWLIDFRRGCFEEAQGGVGFGGVVVEACVEACEGFCVVQPQDGSSQ
jgi:hypothetical protein